MLTELQIAKLDTFASQLGLMRAEIGQIQETADDEYLYTALNRLGGAEMFIEAALANAKEGA
jgi:hypothetical protein